MENILQRAPGINALYTINEPAAARRLPGDPVGRPHGPDHHRVDRRQLHRRRATCKAGKIGATVMQFPAKMAEQGVQAVVKYAKDGTKPSGFIDTGSQLITDKPCPDSRPRTPPGANRTAGAQPLHDHWGSGRPSAQAIGTRAGSTSAQPPA